MPVDLDHLDLWKDLGELIPSRKHPWFPWFCPKPTVRILFYTDDASVVLGTSTDFGVGRLHDLVVNHNDFHATFQVDVLNRHASGHATHRLTSALLAGYDQVWFFGVRQANTPSAPENELTDPEVVDLRAWMDSGGGVLVTGDHANPRPFLADPALDPDVNLGRALGHRIPRAGELRRWEGLPTANISDSHNTQVPVGGLDPNNSFLQQDAVPQELILTRYPVGWLALPWLERYRPHPLFCGRSGPITVFPDHMHEGQLEIPTSFPPGEWPSGPGGQPVPEVVASGTDKRNGATYGVTSAYDGAQAGVGRIVADATWHHYFNVNLQGFPAGSAELDAIGDFFVNLAVWLSPSARRQQMRCWFWWVLATDATVRMVAFHPFHVVGQTGLDVLGRRASQCLVTELVWPWPVLIDERIRFPWPPEELVLGSVLTEFHRVLERATLGGGEDLPARDALVAGGLRAAAEEHRAGLARALDASSALPELWVEKDRFYAAPAVEG